MSNLVSQILTQTKSIVSTELGASYSEIPFIYDVEKNDLRRASLGYGVRPLGAISNPTVFKSYTLDHEFEIILTQVFARAGTNDSQVEEAFNTMYDKADELYSNLLATKINLPTIVLNVQEPSLLEPEVLSDNKLGVLRMQYTVKYRKNLE